MNEIINKQNLKVIFKCIISLLLIFTLCSCNKNDNNIFNSDINTVNQNKNLGNNKDENQDDNKDLNITTHGNDGNENSIVQSNAFINEALDKVKTEISILSGLNNIEISELFNFNNICYIKVKFSNTILSNDFEYIDRNINGEKYIGDFYEIWRYEKDTPRRILYHLKDVKYTQDDNKITIDGPFNNYIINIDDEKQKILYECYYTDILNSDNGDFTCYINNFYSVCVVNNRTNEVILNKYIYINSEFSEEDFVLDNDRAYFPTRLLVSNTGWIKNSNIAYFLCGDAQSTFMAIDIDKKSIFNMCGNVHSTYEGYLDEENGYLISCSTVSGVKMAVDIYMEAETEKQNRYLYLTNLFTLEKIEIAKSIKSSLVPQKEDGNTISYITSFGERVSIDISDMIDKSRDNIIKGFKNMLSSKYDLNKIELKQLIKLNDRYYQTVKINISDKEYKYQLIYYLDNNYKVLIDDSDNINLYKFNDDVYSYVEDGESTKLIQYTDDGKENTIIGEFDDINFSELNNYISLYNKNGNIIILDSEGNKYFEGNVFNDALNNMNSSVDNKTNIELGVSSWGKNGDKYYILTKQGDRLNNIFEVNLIDKSIKDLGCDVDCRYENMYIDISKGYIVYNTYHYKMFYLNDEEFTGDVYLYLKYFNSNEIIEIAHTKDNSIDFHIFDNELNYYYTENKETINGKYVID